ncbi:DNA helicase PcrA [Clostridium botulinum]|uniref:ATP-dependent DNA helicase n=1 Tax=Clostridium botulinum C/D str. DC5 TaxID=1443128 RepID=A0A0A0IK01_CLOBO|nr:DNA helicase PcrA [Clostridium botulinum]KEI00196.1 ATP-dependent DNA helicase PcrA [Clostridium botulinum C/D str. BKT75002]KEI09354.1 ATP-dependent DNA helicase PcrA [Clostridium botulinum C/D str. BKT2873]KGM94667.1 ATP-dependent DNA helicase PcrA [Clostridium botulinum D str. CCUG 7971]KGM99890.1 ATP-dependent DNA helicase PcrA [Clostridium botulinum C/D str. DC5]KOC49405.1 ATP-dependent DNA helicase PcrA [Clostridium botulinum]
MDLKSLLNKEQYKAATAIEGPVLVLAGAGSGKTRVLTYRIAHMIQDLGIPQYNILAITFTNKAAGEMKDRIKKLVSNSIDSMWVSTFHSCCVRILRREIDKLGYSKNFAIYDSSDQKNLVKQCMKELNINDKDINEKEIISKIGKQKDNLITAEEYKKRNERDFRKNKIADVYLLYQKKLKNSNALDFDDLIFKTVELFKKNPDVLEFYQNKFKYIMVDEYQDTNKTQYQLVKMLASAHRNIFVVGDDDQCIYQWRGADIKNILDFEVDYPEAAVIKLEENYRSKANILNAANTVIKHNSQRKNKVLRTQNSDGEKIKIYRAYSDIDEGIFTANEIKRLIEKEDRSFKDFAILYRTNAQSRMFEDVFMKRDIPYRIIGGLKFYDRKEIKDITAYLKFINNLQDDISLKRIINVPKRAIGAATVSKIQEFANYMDECMYSVLLDVENIPGLSKRTISSINKFTSLINGFTRTKDKVSVSNLIQEILESTGYMKELKDSNEIEDISRIENIKELVSAAVEFENTSEDKSLSAFLEKITLVSDVDNYDEDTDTTVMMTLHSAKGLEFPVVFMVGMENGIFPGAQSLENFSEMEESRRLCYVGITRAKEQLYMTSASTRKVFGRTVAYGESDFINEISPSLKELIKEERISKGSVNSSNRRFNDSFNSSNLSSHAISSFGVKKAERTINSILSSSYSSSTSDTESAKNDVNLDEITMGRKVKHEKFGIGTIVSANKTNNDVKVTIAFDNMGVKQLMFNMAPIKLI